jgi:hypothetical protein
VVHEALGDGFGIERQLVDGNGVLGGVRHAFVLPPLGAAPLGRNWGCSQPAALPPDWLRGRVLPAKP